MRIVFLFLLGLFLSPSYLFSTTINGKALAYANSEVKLITYTELFTRQPIHVKTTTIDANGLFKFQYDFNKTRLIGIKIGSYRTNFYVTPNTEYQIELQAFDPKSAPPLSRDKYLPTRISIQDNDSINVQLGRINVNIDTFEQKNYIYFLKNKAKPLVEKKSLELIKNPYYSKNGYYQSYVDCNIGLLKFKSKESQRNIFEQFVMGPIQYHNYAYVALINQFYNKWLNRYDLTNNKAEFDSILTAGNLEQVKAFIGTNDYLKNDTLLELVLAKELFREAINEKDYQPQVIDQLLQQLSETAINKENKQVAKYYLNRLRKLGIGKPAPDFSFIDQYGEVQSLKNYKGKYVYIDFWATWCKPCLKSMEVLRQLYPKYKDKVEFVSINIDERKKRFDKHNERFQYPWTVLYAGDNEQLKSDYDIVLIPLYYLVDPHGNLLQAPAFSPGGGIERTFIQLFDAKKKKEIEIWDWNFDPKNKGK